MVLVKIISFFVLVAVFSFLNFWQNVVLHFGIFFHLINPSVKLLLLFKKYARPVFEGVKLRLPLHLNSDHTGFHWLPKERAGCMFKETNTSIKSSVSKSEHGFMSFSVWLKVYTQIFVPFGIVYSKDREHIKVRLWQSSENSYQHYWLQLISYF